MYERADSIFYKLRFVFAGLFVITCLLVAAVFLSALWTSNIVQAKPVSNIKTNEQLYDSPNAVTGGLARASDILTEKLGTVDDSVSAGAQKVSSAASHSGQTIATGTRFVGSSVVFGIHAYSNYSSYVLGTSLGFMVDSTNHLFGVISDTRVVSAIIKPADSSKLPTIDPHTPALLAPIASAQAAQAVAQTPAAVAPVANGATWPIHGTVTTLFGVPHWPFQPTHTGLDISSGNRSGVVGVKPFKPGKVIEASWSAYGLGNHVVVDHGGGITSVYGHMYSLSVQAGQLVDQNSILGLEGSTGASTGTHLHFEVLVNGQPVDPHLYVPGQPY